MEDKDVYWNLPKKRLQDLCKRYGLSPNMTKANLVNSLKAPGFNAREMLEHDLSGSESVQILEHNLPNIQETFALTGRSRDIQYVFGSNVNDVGCGMESSKVLSSKNDVVLKRKVEADDRNYNRDAYEAEITSSKILSKEVPSFQFYVSSEEGINLVVDLNSSPSDWSKRLENETRDFQYRLNKSGSFREEVELLGNSNKPTKDEFHCNADLDHEMKEGDLQAGSCFSNRESDSSGYVHVYEGKGPISSQLTAFSTTTKMSVRLEDKEHLVFPVLNSVVENHLTSGAESYPSDGQTVLLKSSVNGPPQIKSSIHSVVDSTGDGPIRFNSLEHQNSGIGDKISEDLKLQQPIIHVNSSLLYSGSSASGSLEMQSSKVGCQQINALCSPHRDNNLIDLVDLVDTVETRDDEIANSSTCGNYMPGCPEEWERRKHFNGLEETESLHLKRSLGKTSEDSEADGVLKRKRELCDGEDAHTCAETNAKIPRTRKLLLEIVLPRRSTRLISK